MGLDEALAGRFGLAVNCGDRGAELQRSMVGYLIEKCGKRHLVSTPDLWPELTCGKECVFF